MLATFILQLTNTPEAVERVAGLLRRRGFAVRSLMIRADEGHEILRLTIQVESEHRDSLLEANLRKLPHIERVHNVTSAPSLLREFAVIKVAVTREERAEIMQIATVFRARVIDLCPSSMVIEATGSENKIDGLIEVLAIYGIVEMARTGPVAMLRGIRCGPCSDEVAAVECEEATAEPQ